MTLVEVVVAVGVLAMMLGGILTSLVQMRRLAAASVAQTTALTIVQGYIEQIKNMDITQMVGGSDAAGNPVLNTGSFTLPVYYDKNTPDSLKTSTGTPPAITAVNSGVTPSGVQDNLKGFDMAKDVDATDMTNVDDLSYAMTSQVTWQAAWPGALDYTTAFPATNTGKNYLHMNVWVWIKDESVAAHRSTKIYSITLIYTWAYADGGRVRYMSDVVRTLRSAVTTN